MLTLGLLTLLLSRTSMTAPAIINSTLSSSDLYPLDFIPSQYSRATSFNLWSRVASAVNISISNNIPSILEFRSWDDICRQIARYKLLTTIPNRN